MKKRNKILSLIIFSFIILLSCAFIIADNYAEEDFSNDVINNEDLMPVEYNSYLEDNIDPVKIYGYIIQFKEEPILAKETKLKKLEKKGEIDSAELSSELEEHESKVLETHKLAKKEFEKELKKELKILGEYKSVFNGIALNITTEEAFRLKELDFVKEIYPNYEAHTLLQDSVPLINADDVWNLQDSNGTNITGVGITVAVLDSGIDYNHPDLGGCFGVGCRVKYGWDFVNDDATPMDDNGHGTHCAGIIGANGSIKGVAPDVEFLAYKVCNYGGGCSSANILYGIENATNYGVDIISMSLGGYGNPNDAMSQAVDTAVESGVVVVVSAGNGGPEGTSYCPAPGNFMTICSPGTARKAITFGATDKEDNVTSYSSRGPTLIGTLKPDVVAPGGNSNSSCTSCNSGCCRYPEGINSTIANATAWECWGTDCGFNVSGKLYMKASGTSMSAPHGAGTAALLLQKHPNWTSDEIKMTLRNTGVDVGENHTIQGYGRINVSKAVQLNYPFPIALLTDTSDTNVDNYITGNLNITGIASGDNFVNYTIEVGEGFEPSSWTQISSSNQSVDEGLLLINWDSSIMKEGAISIRLKVIDNESRISEDRLFLNVKNVELTNPNNRSFFREEIENRESIDIFGSVAGDSLINYIISYKNETSSEWIQINSSNQSVEDGLLTTWNISSLNTSFYYIKLNANYSTYNGEDLVKIYVDKEQLAGWPNRFSGQLHPSSLVIGDILNNNENKIMVTEDKRECICVGITCFCISNPWIYFFNHNGSNVAGWPIAKSNLTAASRSASVLGDLNNNGKLEYIYTSNSNYDELFAIQYNGTDIDGFPISLPDYAYLESPTIVADLDNDGDLEIISGNRVFYNNGTEFPGSPGFEVEDNFQLGTNNVGSAVGDLDNDGDLEIVSSYKENLTVWDPIEGNMAGWPQIVFPSYVESSSLDPVEWSALADLDDDGDLEIVVVNPYYPPSGKINAFHHNGSNVTGWPVIINNSQSPIGNPGLIDTSPAIGDLDNDGILEIVVMSARAFSKSKLFIIQSNGTVLENNGWPKEFGLPDFNYRYPKGAAIGDIDDDGEQEIIVQFVFGKIYAWNMDGSNVTGWPKETPTDYDGSLTNLMSTKYSYPPIITDFDSDGDIEIISSIDDQILIWDLNSTYNEDYIDWPKFQNNINNTAVYSNTRPKDSHKFYIRDPSGNPVAWLGDLGNIALKGSCFSGGSCDSPGNDSFIIRNSADENVAFINSTGDLCIETGDCSDESTTCNPTQDAFIIRNSTDYNMSYIDSDGDLCLIGKLYENAFIS